MPKRTLIEIKPFCVPRLQAVAEAMGGASLTDAAAYLIASFGDHASSYLKNVSSVPVTTEPVKSPQAVSTTLVPQKALVNNQDGQHDLDDAFGAIGL